MKGLKLAPAWRRPARLALLALLAVNVAVAAGFTVPRGLAQRRLDDRVAGLKAERAAALERQRALREREELLARNQRDATQLTERLIGTPGSSAAKRARCCSMRSACSRDTTIGGIWTRASSIER